MRMGILEEESKAFIAREIGWGNHCDSLKWLEKDKKTSARDGMGEGTLLVMGNKKPGAVAGC